MYRIRNAFYVVKFAEDVDKAAVRRYVEKVINSAVTRVNREKKTEKQSGQSQRRPADGGDGGVLSTFCCCCVTSQDSD